MKDTNTEKLGYEIIGAAFEVHRNLGRFLYEDVYEQALQAELKLRGIASERQVYMPAIYKGMPIEKSFRIDLLVEKKIPVELKAISSMGRSEIGQIMSYLVFGNYKVGYLINFGAPNFVAGKLPEDLYNMQDGIYRIINSKYHS